MRKLSGFSLMEMMVALLIVAIIAAASAPMVSKKLSGADSAAGIGCLWKTHDDDYYSVTYNSIARGNKSVIIGAKQTNVSKGSFEKPRLYINTSSEKNPHIRFALNGSQVYNLQTKDGGIWFSNKALEGGKTAFVAIGNEVSVGNTAVSIGTHADASGDAAVAIGVTSTADKSSTVAVGNNARATSSYSTALGGASVASADSSVALGYKSTASGVRSSALGYNSTSSNSDSIAIGSGTASGERSVAIGKSSTNTSPCQAIAADAIAIKGSARGHNSIAIGDSSTAGNDCIVIGDTARASNEGAVAIGIGANQNGSGYGSVALGFETSALGGGAIAIGASASASATGCIAIGGSAKATGSNAIAIGSSSSDPAGANEVKLGNKSHKVYLGGCTFENGVAYIDTLHVKRLLVEDDHNTYFNASGDGVMIPYGSKGLKVFGELYADSLSVGNDATFGSPYTKSLVYVRGDFVSDGNSIISRKDGSGAFYKIYNRDTKRFDLLMNLDMDGNREASNKIERGAGYAGSRNGSFDGNWNSSWSSDRRLKNVGEAFTAGLEEIKKLEVFNYVYKKDTTKTPRVGVMAQDLMKIFPNAVFKGDDGFYRIRMEDMFYALVNAVKELDKKIDLLAEKQKEIETLRAEVKSLKKDYADLEKRIEKLEKRK